MPSPRLTALLVALAIASTAVPAGATPLPEHASRPVVYLTFDDGPSEHTGLFLDLLARYGAKATFFQVGNRVAGRASITRRIVANGHRLGNHTWDHRYLPSMSDAGIRSEVDRASQAFVRATGRRPACVRPPGGFVSARVRRILANRGMRTAMWTIDTRDWSPRRSMSGVLAELNKARGGSIVLMHDASPQYAKTLAALRVWLGRNAGRFEFRALPGC